MIAPGFGCGIRLVSMFEASCAAQAHRPPGSRGRPHTIMGQPPTHIGPALRESRRAPQSHDKVVPPVSSTHAPRLVPLCTHALIGLYTPRGHRCLSFYPLCNTSHLRYGTYGTLAFPALVQITLF